MNGGGYGVDPETGGLTPGTPQGGGQMLVPQGPQPQAPGGPAPVQPGMTLGQANPYQPGIEDSPLAQQYKQAMGAVMQMIAPAFYKPIPDPEPPSFLKSIGTFGIANLKHIADTATAREQNYLHDAANRKLLLAAGDLAMKSVDSQARSQAIGNREAMMQAGLAIRAAGLQNQVLGTQMRYINMTHKQLMDATLPPPKDATQAAAYEAQGLTDLGNGRWGQPDTDLGGGLGGGGSPRLTRQPDGSWGVDPNSPAGKVLGAVGGGGGAAGGGSLSTRLAKGEAERKMMVPTSSTRTMSEMAPKVLQLADQVEQSMKGIQAGPLKSRAQEFAAGTLGIGNAPFTKYRTDVGLLQTSLMRMHVGARGGLQMMTHFKNLLDSAKQSPENMKAALDEIRDYATSMLPESQSSTTSTPSSTTPPTTGAPTPSTGLTGTTPGGINFRVVQ